MLNPVPKQISYFILVGGLVLFGLHSCAPEVVVESCTSQKYYPGRQEVAPYQEIVLQLKNVDASVQLDSLVYGDQTVELKGKNNTYFGQAEGTSYSRNATLHYSWKNKSKWVKIDSISQLDPLYLP